MSTHVSLWGIAVRTISHFLFFGEPRGVGEGGVVWGEGGGKRSRGGFSCHFKTNDWSPSWGLGQHRACCWKRGDLWAGAPVPKCPSSSFSKCHSITASIWGTVMSAGKKKRRKNPTTAKENFDPLPCAPPVFSCPVYNSFVSKDSCVRVWRQSRPHSLLSLSVFLSLAPSPWRWVGFSHSTGTWITPIRLDGWEYPPASTHLLPDVSPARRCTDRPDGDDGEDNALRGFY